MQKNTFGQKWSDFAVATVERLRREVDKIQPGTGEFSRAAWMARSLRSVISGLDYFAEGYEKEVECEQKQAENKGAE